MKVAKGSPRVENLFLYTCVVDNPPAGAIHGPAVRNTYIVECCVEGCGAVVINGEYFPVGPGDCYVLLPGDKVTHITDETDPRRGYSCAFDGLQAGRAIVSAGFSAKSPYAPREVFSEVLEQMEKLAKLLRDTDLGAEFRRTAGINAILAALLRHAPNTERDIWVNRVIGLIEAKYDQPITVQSLAKELSLERNYFTSLFKAKTGWTPSAYLTSVRIEKACILLRETNEPVSAVATAVGLDARNFARIFKQIMKKTPLQYKKDKK